MKKTNTILSVLIALTLVFAAGCHGTSQKGGDTQDPAGPGASAGTEGSAPGSPGPAEPAEPPAGPPGQSPSEAEALVSVDFATDGLMGGFETCIVDKSAAELAVKVIIMPAVPLKDFRYTEIGMNEDDPENMLYEKGTLYSADELLPEWPLVVGIDFFGTFPTRGIAFTDGNDAARHFAIAESGNDGSLFLIEFQE